MNVRSLAFRLSLWYGLLLSVAFTLVGLTLFYGVEQFLRSNSTAALLRRALQVQSILLANADSTGQSMLARNLELQLAPEYTNRFLRITRWPSTPIYQAGPPADHGFNPDLVPTTQIWPAQFQTRRVSLPGGAPLLIGRIRSSTASGEYLIEIGSSLESIEMLRERLLLLLGLILPVLIVLAATGGYFLVRRTLQPVDVMSHTAAQISIRDLDARLPVLATGDALERLSVALNEMLARLRDSVQLTHHFLADASHELRTPLTIIKGELQVLASGPNCSSEIADRIGSVLEEVDRLKHLVEGLLAISRLDSGDAKRALGSIDLKELVVTTTEQMRLVAEDAGVAIEYARLQAANVRGDWGRLQQVVVNLLDNAIKYTPRGGTVSLATLRAGREAIFEVRDTGIGIPTQAIPRIFDRFYRVDAARSETAAGSAWACRS